METLALSPRDAAAFLAVSKRTLTRLIAGKKIEARKSGPRTLVDVAFVESVLRELAEDHATRAVVLCDPEAQSAAEGEAQDTALSFKSRLRYDSPWPSSSDGQGEAMNFFDDQYRGLTSPLTVTVSKAPTTEAFQIALLILLAVAAITLGVVLYRRTRSAQNALSAC